MPATLAKKKKLSPKGYAASKTLRDEKIKLYQDGLKLAVDDKNQSRDMTAEDKATFDKYQSRMSAIQVTLGQIEEHDPGEDEPEDDALTRDGGDVADLRARGNPARPDAVRGRVMTRHEGESDGDFTHRQRRATPEYERAVADYICTRRINERAIQADVDLSGGTMVMPETLSTDVLKAVDNILWVQRYATVIDVPNAASLGVPTIESNVDDAEWTTEISAISDGNGPTFGKRSLVPTPIRKRIKVSEKFLRLAMDGVAFKSADDTNGVRGARNIVVNRIAYAIASTMERAFFLGNGVGQPLGLFTASNRGIPVSRDILTGSPTGLTYFGLVNIKFNQKIQYHKSSMWLVNKAFVATAMKLVDTNGRPILNFSTIPQTPDTLLGNAIAMSEFCPGVFASGSYVGIFGDPMWYYIAHSLRMTLAVADQLYLETGQIGFFAGAECDAMPVMPEAFTRIKCG